MKEYKGYNYEKQGQTYTVYDKQGKAWIVGFETEEDAKAQIDDIVASEENAQKEKTEIEQLKEEMTNMQLALLEVLEGGK